jgi:hypothetical protein
MAVSARAKDRITSGLKRLVPIIHQQHAKDVSEADTVTIVKDVFAEVLGYDKYSELTSEHCIRGTYCDLAVKINEKLIQLVEVKAIGTALEDRHVKQVVDYAANEGIEWVMLTNGAIWRLYQVIFAKPIDKRLLMEIDLTTIEPRKQDDLERISVFTREGFVKGEQVELRDRQDATNRFTLAALLLSNDSVIAAIRRELRRLVKVLVEPEEIVKVLRNEVIKRDAMEGADAEQATRRVNRTEAKIVREKLGVTEVGTDTEPPAAQTSDASPVAVEKGKVAK